MTSTDFVELDIASTLPSPLPELTETLYVLSMNKQKKACLDATYSSSSLTAINFDKVKEEWYRATLPRRMRSADALYVHEGKYYLIEFKTGNPTGVDLHRKAYDSVIGLTEHTQFTYTDCREKVLYIVVSPKFGTKSPLDPQKNHLKSLGVVEPWEYKPTAETIKSWDKDDLRKLSGCLVRKVYQLSPEDFNQFAVNRKWSN